MHKLRILAAAGLFALSGACASTSTQVTSPASTQFSFAVIGDIPYSDDDKAVLEQAILPAIKQGGYPFVIHVGDYKGGGAPCTDADDDAQLALIETLAPIPVFYTPGDNEWTDCDRFKDPATGKPHSELQRLAHLRSLFFSETPAAPDAMKVKSQDLQKENLTWTYGGVRFATLHVAATSNGRSEIAGDDPAAAGSEADRRDIADLAWLLEVVAQARHENADALVIAMQADMTDVAPSVLGKPCIGAHASGQKTCDAFVAMRGAIRDAAAVFGGPTLLIHGDTAPFTLGRSFAGDEAPNLWRLNAAGDHGFTRSGVEYGVQDSTLVTFTPGAASPFAARGMVTPATPEAK